mmetsp:Transcript_1297/g.3600  ORF Transcript_1297/g.3600 Transcript_1297/m.3600 type:complete len:173 (+) Transcript_1297:72-590(+)
MGVARCFGCLRAPVREAASGANAATGAPALRYVIDADDGAEVPARVPTMMSSGGSVSAGATPSDLSKSMMQENTSQQTVSELVLDFWDPSSECPLTARFFERPLGIEFVEREPSIVKAVVPNSPAERAGVQRHMLLRAINGKKVQASNPIATSDLHELLRSGSQSLPSRRKR